MGRGAVDVAMCEPEGAGLLPEERLFRAVIEDAIHTLRYPKTACRRIGMKPKHAHLLVDMERRYVASALFELHCAWARLDPVRLRVALRRAGLLG